jgi:hypothetical protein
MTQLNGVTAADERSRFRVVAIQFAPVWRGERALWSGGSVLLIG